MTTTIDKPLTDQDVDEFILYLEKNMGDIPCEISHGPSASCSLKVTHRLRWCQPSMLICANASIAIAIQKSKGDTCALCLKPAAECWKVLPV